MVLHMCTIDFGARRSVSVVQLLLCVTVFKPPLQVADGRGVYHHHGGTVTFEVCRVWAVPVMCVPFQTDFTLFFCSLKTRINTNAACATRSRMWRTTLGQPPKRGGHFLHTEGRKGFT